MPPPPPAQLETRRVGHIREASCIDQLEASCRVEQLGEALRRGSEPTRLCAAYELAARGPSGHAALFTALCSLGLSTSCRRTAMYGALAGRAVTPARLETLFAEAAKEAEEAEEAEEGAEEEAEVAAGEAEAAEAAAGEAEAAEGGGWMAACVMRARDGFDAEVLLAARRPEPSTAFYWPSTDLARPSTDLRLTFLAFHLTFH